VDIVSALGNGSADGGFMMRETNGGEIGVEGDGRAGHGFRDRQRSDGDLADELFGF